MSRSVMHRTVEQRANRAVVAFLICVVVLGAPLIVAMYLVETSSAETLVLAFMVPRNPEPGCETLVFRSAETKPQPAE